MHQCFCSTVTTYLSRFFSAILYGIYPPLCRSCQRFVGAQDVFCSPCRVHLHPVSTLTLQPESAYPLKVFAAGKYEGALKKLVHQKFYGDMRASRQLARLIYEQSDLKHVAIDCIVPIPLHWTRYAARGFNQSRVIAQELGRLLNVPIVPLLARTRRTAFQSSLPLKMRGENVKNAFALAAESVSLQRAGKSILIVDDLLTTGATLQAATRVIKTLRPEVVYGAVACRI